MSCVEVYAHVCGRVWHSMHACVIMEIHTTTHTYMVAKVVLRLRTTHMHTRIHTYIHTYMNHTRMRQGCQDGPTATCGY